MNASCIKGDNANKFRAAHIILCSWSQQVQQIQQIQQNSKSIVSLSLGTSNFASKIVSSVSGRFAA
jgi:hypothetical protein